MIVDSIVDLESDLYRYPDLLESKFESSTIRFRVPNRLSLIGRRSFRYRDFTEVQDEPNLLFWQVWFEFLNPFGRIYKTRRIKSLHYLKVLWLCEVSSCRVQESGGLISLWLVPQFWGHAQVVIVDEHHSAFLYVVPLNYTINFM